MTDNYSFPISPPPELVREWMEHTEYDEHTWFYESYIAERAAQWGADKELEACLNCMNEWGAIHNSFGGEVADELRAARRSKPQSLKEQALALLDQAEDPSWDINDFSIVRRALESIPDPC